MAMDAATRWISILEHDLLDSDLQNAKASFLWCQQDQQLSPALSLENEFSKGETLNEDKSFLKKRAREECGGGVVAKACREKMRRDRLNDRFVELSAVLEPDKPPKTDKASILRDAARILSQLRVETQQLKDANYQLRETIKELKVEKNELRDEKFALKSEKERLEKQLTSVNAISGYGSHPSEVQGASIVSTFSSPQMTTGPHLSKSAPYGEVPFSLAMSQWMTQSSMDISNDHVLRPPVA